MPILDSTQSQPFASIVSAIKTRILNGAVDANALNTYVLCAPDDDMPEHLGEPGYRIRVSPTEPVVMAGAARHGYIAQRRVDVFVITESLTDPGGIDEKAVLAHLNREDSVVDALLLSPPTTLPTATLVTLVGNLIKFMPGGQAISRLLNKNPGLIVSALPFAVTYVPKVLVERT